MERKDVNVFLRKDFWGYMYEGGIHPGQLTGASLDLAPSGHSNTNKTEKSYVETMSKAEGTPELEEFREMIGANEDKRKNDN